MSLAIALAKVKLVSSPASVAPATPAKPEVFHSIRQHPKVKGMAIITSVKPSGEKVEKALWRPEANAKVFSLKNDEQAYRASVKAWESFYGKRFGGGEEFRASVAKAFAQGRKPRLGRLA